MFSLLTGLATPRSFGTQVPGLTVFRLLGSPSSSGFSLQVVLRLSCRTLIWCPGRKCSSWAAPHGPGPRLTTTVSHWGLFGARGSGFANFVGSYSLEFGAAWLYRGPGGDKR